MADYKEQLGQVQARLKAVSAAVIGWAKRYRPWLFSGLTVLSILLIVWARFGFQFEFSQFFAAEETASEEESEEEVEGEISIECGAAEGGGNVIEWTAHSDSDSNSLQRGNSGAKNLPDCADYWCWLPRKNFNHQTPSPGSPATYTDTNLQEGVCYGYRAKYQPQLPSNTVFCPANCDQPPEPSVDITCDDTDGPCIFSGEADVTIDWKSSDVVECDIESDLFTDDLEDAINTARTRNPDLFTDDKVIVGKETEFLRAACDEMASSALCSVDAGVIVFEQSSVSSRVDVLRADGSIRQPLKATYPSQEPIGSWDVTLSRNVSFEISCPATEKDVSDSVDVDVSAGPAEQTLSCAPVEQTVGIGQEAVFEASGGDGDYAWMAEQFSSSEAVLGDTFSIRYEVPGSYRITVEDGGGFSEAGGATCDLFVVDDTVSPTPTPPVSADLHVRASVRNFSEDGNYNTSATGRPSQQFQVFLEVSSGGIVPNTIVRAALPDTVTYVPGTTTIAGQPTAVNAVTEAGLAIGPLNGSERITFNVVAKGAGQLPSGTLTSILVGRANGDGVGEVNDSVTLIIENGSTVPIASRTPTGPGDVALLSFMAAALITLLYVSYTHTHLYRSREVGSITKKRDGMNFRS